MKTLTTSPRTENTPAKQAYLDDELAAQVDEIRWSQRFPSGCAAMRHLIEAGLAAAGYLSDGN